MAGLKPWRANTYAKSLSRPAPSDLQRLSSGQLLDEQLIYQDGLDIENLESDKSLAASDLSPADSEQDAGHAPNETASEPKERDFESGPAQVEKQAPTNLAEDSDLVSATVIAIISSSGRIA